MADPEQIAADALIACHRSHHSTGGTGLPSREAEGRFVVAALREAGQLTDPPDFERDARTVHRNECHALNCPCFQKGCTKTTALFKPERDTLRATLDEARRLADAVSRSNVGGMFGRYDHTQIAALLALLSSEKASEDATG